MVITWFSFYTLLGWVSKLIQLSNGLNPCMSEMTDEASLTYKRMDILPIGKPKQAITNKEEMMEIGQAESIQDRAAYVCTIKQNHSGYNRTVWWSGADVSEFIDQSWNGRARILPGSDLRKECRLASSEIANPEEFKLWITMQTQSSKHTLASTTLVIKNAQYFHNGLYACNVLTAEGKRASRIFRLDVIGKPSLAEENVREVYNVLSDNDLSVSCPFDAAEQPTYRWYYRSSSSPYFTLLHIHKRLFTVERLGHSIINDGYLRCVANNRMGSQSKDFKFTISMAPKFTDYNKLGDHKVAIRVLEHPVILHCPIIAFPQPIYEWYFDNQYDSKPEIRLNSTSSIHYIASMNINDIGMYRCKVVNELGEKEIQITLLNRDTLLKQKYEELSNQI